MAKPKIDLSSIDTSQGEAQHKFAGLIAKQIDGDAAPIIQHLTNIKAEYEGGPFVVLFNVLGSMDEATIDRLPPPDVDTGNNPSVYKIKVRNGKTEKLVECDFYDDIAEQLPSVMTALNEKDQLARSLGDPGKINQSDIPEMIAKLPPQTRQARIDKLSALVSTARRNVKAAFVFYHQAKAIEALDTVKMSLIYALDDNGQICDGEDGREYRVENTKSPIVLTSTMKGREALDTKRLSLSTFNNIDVDRAKEAIGGATYHALINTVAKGPDQALPVAGVNINTVGTFFNLMNDVSEYLDRTLASTDKAAWQAIEKVMSAKDKTGTALEDADLAFYNVAAFVAAFRPLVTDPVSEVRYQALLNKYADPKAKPKIKKAA
jgi:hypothetical protein